MNRLTKLTVCVMTLALSSALAADPRAFCKNVHVLTCNGEVDFYDLDDWSSPLATVSLGSGAWSAHEPSSITFSTHPKSDHNTSFVTQGGYIHVIENHDVSPWRSLPLADICGVDFLINDLAVAPAGIVDPVTGGNVYWTLAVGSRDAGTHQEPHFALINQLDLIETDADNFPIVVQGSICDGGGTCSGTATRVTARNLPSGSVEFHVSIVDPQPGTNNAQRIVRLEIAPDGSFSSAMVDDDDVPFGGNVPRQQGLDYDLNGDHYATYQTQSEIVDVATGTSSCSLAGDPTSMATWGPQSSGTLLGTYHFITLDDNGNDALVGVPAGACPGSPGSISLPLGLDARAVAISSREDNRFWIYAGTRGGTLYRYDFVLAQGSGVSHFPWVMSSVSRSSDCVVDITIERVPTMGCGESHCGLADCDPGDDCEFDPDLNPHCTDTTPPSDDRTPPGGGVCQNPPCGFGQ